MPEKIKQAGGLINFLHQYRPPSLPAGNDDFMDLLADWKSELPTPTCYILGCRVFLTPAYDEDTGKKTHILEITGSEEEQEAVREWIRNFVKETE